MKPSGNVKDLMAFLGFVNYLGKIPPNLSEISSPLDTVSQEGHSMALRR